MQASYPTPAQAPDSPSPGASPGLALDHFRSPPPDSAGPSVSASPLPLSPHDRPAGLGLATPQSMPHSPLDHFSFLILTVRPNIQVAKNVTHLQQTAARTAARRTTHCRPPHHGAGGSFGRCSVRPCPALPLRRIVRLIELTVFLFSVCVFDSPLLNVRSATFIHVMCVTSRLPFLAANYYTV